MVFKASFEFYGQPHQLSSLPDGEEQEPDTKYHITTNSAGARESYEWTKQERSPFFGPVGPACIRQDKTQDKFLALRSLSFGPIFLKFWI